MRDQLADGGHAGVTPACHAALGRGVLREPACGGQGSRDERARVLKATGERWFGGHTVGRPRGRVPGQDDGAILGEEGGAAHESS